MRRKLSIKVHDLILERNSIDGTCGVNTSSRLSRSLLGHSLSTPRREVGHSQGAEQGFLLYPLSII